MKNFSLHLREGAEVTGAFITAIFGILQKIPVILYLFVVAMTVDYITGFIKSKYVLHDWQSSRGKQGILKKVMYLALIGISFLIGYSLMLVGQGAGYDLSFCLYLGWYTTATLMINEYTSILENLYVIIPDKIPVWLVKGLKITDGAINDKISGIICKNQNCDTCDLKDRCTQRKS